MILIGYSGHSYVINGILQATDRKATGYCDNEEKKFNPLSLKYHFKETSEKGLQAISQEGFFISVGNNKVRQQIYTDLAAKKLLPVNIIHPSAMIDKSVQIDEHGVMIGIRVIINALAKIGAGAICNTRCIIEHECIVGDFVHIGPGAVLCGNVQVGENSFVGARAVVRENIRIGKNVMIGAGSVVVKDIPDNTTVAGNPAKPIGALQAT